MIVLVISFSDYKTVKDFYIQANLISEYYRKDEVATDEEYREKFSYEIFKMYLQKLGRLENGSVSKLVSHGFHSLKEIHDKTKNAIFFNNKKRSSFWTMCTRYTETIC